MEQLFGQVPCFEQSEDVYGSLHLHTPFMQVPCPEQLLGQAACFEQSELSQPGLHLHVPFMQLPWPEQKLGQRSSGSGLYK